MRVAIWPIERSAAYADALRAAGHDVVSSGVPADVLLVDFDSTEPPHSDAIAYYEALGARIFMFPHGVGFNTAWDGIHPVTPSVQGAFVVAEGQAEVMRRYGYPRPTHPVGWTFGTFEPFRPCADVRRVLFAPWHPIYERWIVPEFADANRRAFAALLRCEGIELTVRHIDSLELNGLPAVDGVRYVQGRMDGSTLDMDEADVVVSPLGTYAFKALARGVPLVWYGQDVSPLDIIMDPDGSVRVRGYGQSWDRYRDYIRYPFDLDDGDPLEVLRAAARSDEPVREFRRRFIGEQLDAPAFVELLERLCDVRPGEAYAGRRAASVLALADEIATAPALLAGYARAVAPDADQTLVLLAPSVDDATVAGVEAAIAAAGLDDDTLPDVLLAAAPLDPVEQRALVREATAFLGGPRPPAWLERLPAFDVAA